MAHNSFSLPGKLTRKRPSKRDHALSPTRDEPITEEMRNILVEAFHLFPEAAPVKYFVGSKDDALPASMMSSGRFGHVQDYVYGKTGVLYSVAQIRCFFTDMKHAGTNDMPARLHGKRLTSQDPKGCSGSALIHGDFAEIQFPLLSEDRSSPSSDLFVDPFKLNNINSAIHLIASTLPAPIDTEATVNIADGCGQLASSQTPSMSRRRLASNIPALKCHVDLPPPPSALCFKDLVHQSGLRKAPRRSHGLTISSPNLLGVLPTSQSMAPMTPMDQVMNAPLQPPEAPRRSIKKSTAYSSGFSKAWDFSPDIPPFNSAALEDPQQDVFSDPLDAVPITPVDQVMKIPQCAPELPHRRSRQATIRDTYSEARCPPLSALYPSSQATPTQRERSSSIKHPLHHSSTSPLRKDKRAMDDNGCTSPFVVIDTEKTPMPPQSTTSRLPKHRPPPLFSLPERPLRTLAPSAQLPLSPVSPIPRGAGEATLPLASPFWAVKAGGDHNVKGLRTSTPLAGVTRRPMVEALTVGTPSYFNTPSYFVDN